MTKSLFRAGFSTEDTVKTINLAFRGITIQHKQGYNWLGKLVDFFTPSPASPSSVSEESTIPHNSYNENEDAEPASAPGSTTLHVDFDDVAVLYTPPSSIESRLVLCVEDLRLHVLQFSPLSLQVHSESASMLLWDGVSKLTDVKPWHDGYH